jgi:hypothetical protein
LDFHLRETAANFRAGEDRRAAGERYEVEHEVLQPKVQLYGDVAIVTFTLLTLHLRCRHTGGRETRVPPPAGRMAIGPLQSPMWPARTRWTVAPWSRPHYRSFERNRRSSAGGLQLEDMTWSLPPAGTAIALATELTTAYGIRVGAVIRTPRRNHDAQARLAQGDVGLLVNNAGFGIGKASTGLTGRQQAMLSVHMVLPAPLLVRCRNVSSAAAGDQRGLPPLSSRCRQLNCCDQGVSHAFFACRTWRVRRRVAVQALCRFP